MTTDRLNEPGERAEAVNAVTGGGQGLLAADGPTTTVQVMPLWACPVAGRRAVAQPVADRPLTGVGA